jgi:hypothetical protein
MDTSHVKHLCKFHLCFIRVTDHFTLIYDLLYKYTKKFPKKSKFLTITFSPLTFLIKQTFQPEKKMIRNVNKRITFLVFFFNPSYSFTSNGPRQIFYSSSKTCRIRSIFQKNLIRGHLSSPNPTWHRHLTPYLFTCT